MMALHHIQWCSHFPMMAYKCFLWWYTDTISTTMRKPVQLWFPCFVLKKMHDEGCYDRVVWWWNRCLLAMEQTLSNSNTIASIFKTMFTFTPFLKNLSPPFTPPSPHHLQHISTPFHLTFSPPLFFFVFHFLLHVSSCTLLLLFLVVFCCLFEELKVIREV